MKRVCLLCDTPLAEVTPPLVIFCPDCAEQRQAMQRRVAAFRQPPPVSLSRFSPSRILRGLLPRWFA
jgi:hypothetical protein